MRRVDVDAFREVGEFFVRPTFKGLDAMFVPFAHSLPGAEDRMTIEDVVTRYLAEEVEPMTNGILGNPLHTTLANFLNDAMTAGNKEGVQKELLRFAPENAQTKTMEMLQFWPERGFQSRVPACD